MHLNPDASLAHGPDMLVLGYLLDPGGYVRAAGDLHKQHFVFTNSHQVGKLEKIVAALSPVVEPLDNGDVVSLVAQVLEAALCG